MSKPDWVIREETQNLAKFETDAYLDDQQVPRWKSNNQVPMSDMLHLWHSNGKKFSLRNALKARDKETRQFFAQYKAARLQMTDEQIAEERLEARAALGSGQEVVNIITGERFRT